MFFRTINLVFSVEMLVPVLGELPPLVNEADLHIAQLTLALLTSIVTVHPSAIQIVKKSSLSQV